MAQALLGTSDWTRCYALSRDVVAAYATQVAASDPRVVRACTWAALAAQRLGDLSEAERLYRRALAIQEQKFGPNAVQTAGALHNLVNVIHNSGRHAEAEQLYRRLLAIWEMQSPQDEDQGSYALDGISCMLNAEGRTADALPYYRRSAVIRERLEYTRTHVPVNPRFYTHLYGEALQKLGWRPEQVTAEFQAVATEACGR